jgi:hypothetical protein
VLRWLAVLGLSLASSLAAAQPASQPASAQPLSLLPLPSATSVAKAGRLGRSGALVGVVSAGLLLGGAIAIVAVEPPAHERVTRGLHLGYTALSTPFVAFTAYLTRRRSGADPRARRALRRIGWFAYALAVANDVALWYGAFHGQHDRDALTIGTGVLGAFAVLPQAFDAYMCARQARVRALGFSVSGLGVALRF